MLSRISRRVCVLGLVLAMGACEPRTQDGPTLMALTGSDPFGSIDMKLKISGMQAKEAVSTEQSLAEVLDALDAPPNNNLGRRIKVLQNAPTAKMRGLGGVQARALLDAADAALDKDGNFAGPPEVVTVKGQIQSAQNGEPGFLYKSGEPMHIWVQMVTTSTRTKGKNPKSKISAEMFRVEIPFDQMEVEPKTGPKGNLFPEFAKLAFNVSEDMIESDLDFKLWAVGAHVRVTDYWIDDNVNPNTGPVYAPGRKYTASNATNAPKYVKEIFAADSEACFDMMFAKDPSLPYDQDGALQDGQLPAGSEPPYYCLGRCKNPPIVNTR
ncbi:hypothetical protein M1105_18780 [Limibaculum sp. FT325]|uniref:hypothetical protein n=1 Tax=Thermohalobaculum sediminis TaxID=2939436 RepID=UPI0020BE5ADC|nr:hypothetical protein [Limibaculum sediminis]MCL5779015.1 hypothetical protein [Limibaculum sediminis]